MGTADDMVAICAFPTGHTMLMPSTHSEMAVLIEHKLAPGIELQRAIELFERGERWDTVGEAWTAAVLLDQKLWYTEYGVRPIALKCMEEEQPYRVLDQPDVDDLLVQMETTLLHITDYHIGKLTTRQLASLRFYRTCISNIVGQCEIIEAEKDEDYQPEDVFQHLHPLGHGHAMGRLM
jgi:hypothetical protein